MARPVEASGATARPPAHWLMLLSITRLSITLLWGGSPAMNKFAVAALDAIDVVAIRLALGAVLLWLVVLVQRRPVQLYGGTCCSSWLRLLRQRPAVLRDHPRADAGAGSALRSFWLRLPADRYCLLPLKSAWAMVRSSSTLRKPGLPPRNCTQGQPAASTAAWQQPLRATTNCRSRELDVGRKNGAAWGEK
jgi:hypothetical protein